MKFIKLLLISLFILTFINNSHSASNMLQDQGKENKEKASLSILAFYNNLFQELGKDVARKEVKCLIESALEFYDKNKVFHPTEAYDTLKFNIFGGFRIVCLGLGRKPNFIEPKKSLLFQVTENGDEGLADFLKNKAKKYLSKDDYEWFLEYEGGPNNSLLALRYIVK